MIFLGQKWTSSIDARRIAQEALRVAARSAPNGEALRRNFGDE
jgi:hypothetical protein